MIDFTTRPLHFRRHNPFHDYNGSVLWAEQAIGAVDFTERPDQERYVLQATVGIEFWANRAELETAREIARRTVVSRLFQDVGMLLPNLKFAIYNGDRDEAMALVGKIEEVVRG